MENVTNDVDIDSKCKPCTALSWALWGHADRKYR
jgi:hypothetical protein